MMPSNPHYRPAAGFEVLYIVGAGGFGREVAWLSEQSWGDSVQPVFVVDKDEYLTGPVGGIEVRLLSEVRATASARYVVGIGDPADRRRAVRQCEEMGLAAATLTHPRCEMSRRISIAHGTIICAGVIATTDIVIGEHAHINLDCTIGHDVRIGAFTTLSPGVHVSGRVHIGDGVYIGTGAAIINGAPGQPLVIGEGSLIAAGACVTRSVDPGAMVAGVPAVRKR